MNENLSFAEWIARAKETSLERTCQIQNEASGNLNDIDGYDCPKCKNKGFTFIVSGGEIKSVRCTCQKSRRSLWLLKKSGLDKVCEKLTLDNFKVESNWQKVVLDKARFYLEDEGGSWFYIGGQSGAGKTHICTAIAVELLKKGNSVKYMLWRDEVTHLKSIVNADSYVDAINEYKSVDVLYIDDFFKVGKVETQRKQKPTAADINIAFEIINHRTATGKKTIISSECSIADLIEIDEALAGRIKQNCGTLYCVNIPQDKEKNYRLR